MTGAHLVVRDAELDGARVDVVISGSVIESVVPSGLASPNGARAVETIDAAGGALLPGLHDHHIHLLALAAADASVTVGPPAVANAPQLADALRRRHGQLAPSEWMRAVDYHESVAGNIDRAWLDALGIERPIRIQHRSGMAWVLNSAAIDAIGGDAAVTSMSETDSSGRSTGWFYRADNWLRERTPPQPIDLGAVGRRLAGYGIVGVTDLTPTVDAASVSLLAEAVAHGALPLGVTITGSPDLPSAAEPRLPRGPVKIVVDEHGLPAFDELVATFRRVHRSGRPVAVHCVTRATLALLVGVWSEAGAVPGDRLEHGAVIPPELFAELAVRGITVVTQPSFVHDRGDRYLVDVDAIDRPHLWRCGSLLDAGIPVAFGSDAPYGDPDPWASIRTAARRLTRDGVELGADEAISARRALDLFLGTATQPTLIRRVAVGEPADLCLLDRSMRDQLADPTADGVRATIVSGRVTSSRA